MGKLLCLPTSTERGPHFSGEAHCLHCKHEWIAVAPVGTIELECPECKTMKGLLRYGCEPETAWVCGCGCHLFMISPQGTICWKCGEYQVGF
jgi:phage FluMu protein Com